MADTGQTKIDYDLLEQTLAAAKTDQQLFQAIVDAPFEQRVEMAFMFLGIIVLLLVNPKTGMIDRVALSNTELAKSTTDVSVVPFEEIKIPLDTTGNIIARAIREGQPQDTTDWRFLFYPALTPEQARINQASAGIAYSAVCPFRARDGGALIFSYFQHDQGLSEAQTKFMSHYAALTNARLESKG